MIEVKNLRKEYPQGKSTLCALDGIDVKIEDGEIFGFIGLSGAGKTSLVRCISSLEPATSGSVAIDGVDLTTLRGKELREARKKLGLVFQHFNLLMNSTIFENVAFPLRISKEPPEYIEKRTTELLELVGLTDKRDTYPSKLSGGQKQRVGIARALAGNPSIIICDEATSALDPATTKSILQLIKDINIKERITIIVITHEMDVIKEICTKVAVMQDGRIIEMGDVVKVCTRPQTETAREFFKMASADLSNNAYEEAHKTAGIIIRATFTGETTVEPHISRMIKNYDVEAAILSGQIEEIGGTIVGCLVLKLSGAPGAIAAAMNYLTGKNIILETEGTVK